MSITTGYGDEQAAIEQHLVTQWGNRTVIVHPNSEAAPAGAEHIEWQIISQEAFNVAGMATQKEVRHPGMLRVDIRVPLGTGDGPARDHGDYLMDLFRNTSIDRITFRAPTLRALGRDGDYYRVQVDCPFWRDSIYTN